MPGPGSGRDLTRPVFRSTSMAERRAAAAYGVGLPFPGPGSPSALRDAAA